MWVAHALLLSLKGHWKQSRYLIAGNQEALLDQIICTLKAAIFMLDTKNSVIANL
jgi:hypothetical protein